MTRLPAILRAIVLALLVLALALPSLWRPTSVAGRVVRIRAASDLEKSGLLAGSAPAATLYESATPPSPTELETLAAASARAPLFGVLPATARTVDASATARPLAGRAAAVSFRLHGAPGDSARVYLAEAGDVADSLWVKADARGEAAGAFRVRPALAGWREWQLRARWPRGDSAVAAAGAMVDSAGPPRVLLRAGFPDWEAKFVTRALEESGARVEQSLPLGRGLVVTEGAGSAISAARLTKVDAVVVLDGAPLGGGEAAALAEWAARGGGVLLAGDRSGAPGFGLVRAGSRVAPVDGGTIRWALPPELAPLPRNRVGAAAQPFEAELAGSFAGATSPAGPLLALRPLGRGRAAALAITETWRWRMEAGRVAEHREFWRSLVDWLSSARPEPLAIQLADASGPVGVRREVRVFDTRERAADPPPPLVLTRPDGSPDTLRLSRDAASPGLLRAWFVPAAEGVHTFAFAGQPPRAAFRAMRTPPASADAWARLGMITARSGGRMLPPDSVRATLSRLGPASSGGWRGPSPWLLFIALLLLASAEWAIRRFGGEA